MSDKTCHCGQPIHYGYTDNPTDHRGMCAHCDDLRCDTDPGACKPNMRLQERIACALIRRRHPRLSLPAAVWDTQIGWSALLDAKAVIDELGLVEEHEYHTRRHRYVTSWVAD